MRQFDEEAMDLKAQSYADQQLERVNPLLASSQYRRSVKMKSPCFSGSDIELAFSMGYLSGFNDGQGPCGEQMETISEQ